MFLFDYAEFTQASFGRKVRKTKSTTLDVPTYNISSGIYPTSIRGGYERGSIINGTDRSFMPRTKDNEMLPFALHEKTKSTTYKYNNNFDILNEVERNVNKKPIRLNGDDSEKLLKKQKALVIIEKKSSPKTSRKLLNKYTLGAAGLLGASAVGYGGYKLLKRNKKGDKK